MNRSDLKTMSETVLAWSLGVSMLTALGATEPFPTGGSEPHPIDGVRFVIDRLMEYPIVAIGDLPGCVEVHAFLKMLMRNPELVGKLNDVVVDFGNPRFQVLIDRYVLSGEMVPRQVLRHVWDDTTSALQLTWDSPVYEEFFDTVRAVNMMLPPDKRIHVILADAPIDWAEIRSEDQVKTIGALQRSESLAVKVNRVISQGHRALVISSASEQFRVGAPNNARAIVEKTTPGKFVAILAQGRFGDESAYKQIEAVESSWNLNTIAAVKGTSLGTVRVSSDPKAPKLEDAVDAVLYVGPSDWLTIVYPWAFIFQDHDYWQELNRRSWIVNGGAFQLANVHFDLRSRLGGNGMPPLSKTKARASASATPPPSASGEVIADGNGFILGKLNRHRLIGVADVHQGLELYQFLDTFVHDARVPGKVNDIVVEFGNPLFQATMDRYVLGGENISRDRRKNAWRHAAMGWSTADVPVYERFFDAVHDANLRLPKSKRLRVILGDAPVDYHALRKNPIAYMHDFVVFKETAKDPREIALAASANAVISAGHHGIMICGGGHLTKGGRPGNAREFIEAAHPGEFFLIAPTVSETAPFGSIFLNGDHALLSLGGPIGTLSEVHVPPLIFRDRQYLRDIILAQGGPIDFANPRLEYRGRYFERPVPPMLKGASDLKD